MTAHDIGIVIVFVSWGVAIAALLWYAAKNRK